MKLTDYYSRTGMLLLAFIMLTACSSTKNTGSSSRDPSIKSVDSGYGSVPEEYANQSNIMVRTEKEKPSNLSLTEKLQRLPGVRVASGRGPYAQFTVDGTSNSFMANSGPLFVVDGRVIGSDYSNVYTLVNPNDVKSLSVLKGADASIYGSRGANGVILIRTK